MSGAKRRRKQKQWGRETAREERERERERERRGGAERVTRRYFLECLWLCGGYVVVRTEGEKESEKSEERRGERERADTRGGPTRAHTRNSGGTVHL
jgi:hypothetical protein